MSRDEALERAVQALLDGRALERSERSGDTDSSASDPLRLIDAIFRAHRVALFGGDLPADGPPSRWGHLDVGAEIGRGASGTVHRAWDTQLLREVALKLLSFVGPSEGALQEGRLLARLNHANIVRVFGADVYNGVAGVWMELLEGETLEEILVRDGVFGVEESLFIGIGVSRALSVVHGAGMLHRDVKTSNVIRERGGRVVLTDFSAGRVAERSPAQGDHAGTPMYMAPEVLAGDLATPASDVYSLGVLLYRLLTATYPVRATDLAALQASHKKVDRLSLATLRPDLAPEVASAIETGCATDVAARHATAADFERSLTHALQTTLSRLPTPSRRAHVWRRRRRRLSAGGAALVVALLGLWLAWDTTGARHARRSMQLSVPPRSPLFLSMNGAIGILRAGMFTLVPGNPTFALSIAVSDDSGIVTMPGYPPWKQGGHFSLAGDVVPDPPLNADPVCCFVDGTTDGAFNYTARVDSTLLDPIGSRPLAPAMLYRFTRQWSHPEAVFRLTPGGQYRGVGYSRRLDTFWLARVGPTASVVEQWSRDGRLLSTPIEVVSPLLGLAVEPDDGTIWLLSDERFASAARLLNFDVNGRYLGSFGFNRPLNVGIGGLEFSWARR